MVTGRLYDEATICRVALRTNKRLSGIKESDAVGDGGAESGGRLMNTLRADQHQKYPALRLPVAKRTWSAELFLASRSG